MEGNFSDLPGVSEYSASTDILNSVDLHSRLLNADNVRCRLQSLPESILTDNTQGHWDLFWPAGKSAAEEWYAAATLPEPMEARDPARDIQKASVAIDFGTSSTVVAMRDRRGGISLLRVGVQAADMRKPITPEHFENPTVLSFENVPALLAAWQNLPYRPNVNWNDVQCSHQARAELAAKIHSGFSGIKTWARGKCQDEPHVLSDSQGNELILYIPPVGPGGSLEAELTQKPLNPIELYAFFLGLHLNNQLVEGGRIFTHYYMTFPVKFDRETRDRILSGFRCGLLRSLPPSLIYASGFDPSKLTVEERANEPAAFAAAVLPLLDQNSAVALGENISAQADMDEENSSEHLSVVSYEESYFDSNKQKLVIGKPHKQHAFLPITPTSAGVAFGVFDFGGGTADFAIGLYRLPTAEEKDIEGWEKVLEILDTAGDENLGGEHLVHHMAFTVVKNNMDKLLAEGVIPFVRPIDAPHITGGEEIFSKNIIARANTKKLCEKLRPIWESGNLGEDNELPGQISETFTGREGTERPLILNVDEHALQTMLKERIARGVDAFFSTFKQAFKSNEIETNTFHIILAGNSCKSPLVMECFRQKAMEILNPGAGEGGDDKIFIYPPLLPDEKRPEGVTLKTGVAIGLLQTLDDESFGIVARHSAKEETPFGFYLGPMVEERLQPVLQRNMPYGKWHRFSKVRRHGKSRFLYSLSPLAIEGQARRGENCIEDCIDWGGENVGKTIVVRATGPDSVTFALQDEQGSIIDGSEKLIVLER